jgi:3-isopropylmalate/(R)-2-methylmalate dehydratase large subunit
MEVRVEGEVGPGVSAKDIVLHITGVLRAAGGTGYVIEYTGSAIRALSIEGRLTVSNMAIEHGARAGLIAPDEVTFAYVKGRPYAPKGADWDAGRRLVAQPATDPGAAYDKVVVIDAADIAPTASPGAPAPKTSCRSPAWSPRRKLCRPLQTGSRPRASITWASTRHAADRHRGPERLHRQLHQQPHRRPARRRRRAERPHQGRQRQMGHRRSRQRALSRRRPRPKASTSIFIEAGLEWREPGCSACLAMNPDKVPAGERCASTSNRNFVGRQGPGARTHLVSPCDGGGGGGDRQT